MELLEKGPGWVMECQCTGKGNGDSGCGAKLLLIKEDIYLTHSSDYNGGQDFYYTFKCMECGAETDIEGQYIPLAIRSNLINQYRNQKVKKLRR